jgi:hypothetical protein
MPADPQIATHVELWEQCLGDGNLDAQEIILLKTLGQGIRDRGDLEEVAAKLDEALKNRRERFLQAMAWPFGYVRKIGECMCWDTFEVTKEKLEFALGEDGATNDCSEETDKGKMDLRELFGIFPTPLALVLGVIPGLAAMLAQAAFGHTQLPDASTVVIWWSRAVLFCRMLAAHKSNLSAAKLLQSLGELTVYIGAPVINLNTDFSDLVGETVSFGHGSSRRWKVYIPALRDATEKILNEATIGGMMQEARTFYVAVILSSAIVFFALLVGYTSWVSGWLGSFLAVFAARVLVKFVPALETRVPFIDPRCV